VAGRLLILGAGGHGRAVADLAEACGFTVAGFTEPSGRGRDVVGTDDDLGGLAARLSLDGAVIGVGNTALVRRTELFARVRRLGLALPVLRHPSTVVSPSARIGEGTVVFPHAVVGAECVIGMNVVVYSGCVIEHDCRIDDHAYLSPGAILCGEVQVHERAFVGAGAVAVPGVVIGKGATVDALVRVGGSLTAGARLSMTRTIEPGR
jgi:sugar O-acyltransferase (sialic acid O-acetyltransferase NeuD family)